VLTVNNKNRSCEHGNEANSTVDQ